MFKRVLICHDGSDAGLRALKRGAALATLLKPKVHVLSFYSSSYSDAVMAASAVGQHCVIDLESEHRDSLQHCVDWLKARGIEAEGHLAHGNTINEIVEHARRLSVDLIVIGHYPRAGGGRWWSGRDRVALAERVNCSVFIAVGEAD
jgi:nucleotide-binding universal stress UspA family protein